jgi:ABC-type sugar transport system ATPase subunit
MLEVRGVSSPGRLHDISLSVFAGEIVGLGGLVGCGRSELLNAIFGLDPGSDGQVLVSGKTIDRSSPRGPIDGGIGYVPEDRRNQGLFFQLGIDENILVPVMPKLAHAGVRNGAAEQRLVADRVQEFQVKTASFSSTPGELSGGNQQKLLIARWMSKQTRVLLLDEPTRGIDVGTKAEIYKLVRAAADAGAAVLLVSSEMPELLALSDRVLVMCEGRISGELQDEAMTQANILRLATANDQVPSRG